MEEEGLIANHIDLNWLRSEGINLIRDIVLQVDKASALAEHYGISKEKWEVLRSNSYFKKVVAEVSKELSGKNTRLERITAKAQIYLDDLLVAQLGSIANDVDTAPSLRLDAMKQISDLAGAGRKSKDIVGAQSSLGPLVSITFTNGNTPTIRTVNDPQIEQT